MPADAALITIRFDDPAEQSSHGQMACAPVSWIIVGVVALAAAVAVVAVASTSANGLPSYTDGYAKWSKINKRPFTKCGPPCAHSGVKNVYASKRKARRQVSERHGDREDGRATG